MEEKEAPATMGHDPTTHAPNREDASMAGARRHGRRLLAALSLAALLVLVTLSGVALAGPRLPQRPAVPAIPRSLCASDPGKCVSVTPGYGMAGTQLTLKGTSLTPGARIVIGYSATDCAGTIITISGATGTVGADGAITIVFTWPSTAPGKYAICATDSGTGTTLESPGGFQVLSPALTVSSPVASGGAVQVSGKDFFPSTKSGGQVEVLYGADGSNGCANSVATAAVADDGTFNATFNAPAVTAETKFVVVAVEPQKSCGATPNLQAQATLDVQAPQPQLNPTISVSGPVDAGKPVTVTGKHFSVGVGQVQILYGGSDGCQTAAVTTTVNNDGSFTATFNAPSPDKDTTLTVKAVQPPGFCAQPKFSAQATLLVHGKVLPPAPTPAPPTLVFCVIGLLFLLLLLALLLFFLRRRKKDEPVTIQELDRIVVNAQGASTGGAAGQMTVERDVYAVDAKGRQQLIGQSRATAEEVYTSEEEIVDDARLPRFGPGGQ